MLWLNGRIKTLNLKKATKKKIIFHYATYNSCSIGTKYSIWQLYHYEGND